MDRPCVWKTSRGRWRHSIGCVADCGAGCLGDNRHINRRIVKTAVLAEFRVLYKSEHAARIRRVRCAARKINPVRAGRIQAVRIIFVLLIKLGREFGYFGDSVWFYKSEVLTIHVHGKIGVQARGSSILSGRVNDQIAVGGDVSRWQTPALQVRRRIREVIAVQVNGRTGSVAQLDPIHELAILIGESRAVARHEFIDKNRLGSDEGGAQRHGGQTQTDQHSLTG